MGCCGWSSVIGVLTGMPYVAQEELKTMRGTAARAIASRSASPLTTFTR